MTRCAVVGAEHGDGAADLLARNGHEVRIWAYDWDVVETITTSTRRRFLAGNQLAETLVAYNDMEEALFGAELVTLATPSHVLRRFRNHSRVCAGRHSGRSGVHVVSSANRSP